MTGEAVKAKPNSIHHQSDLSDNSRGGGLTETNVAEGLFNIIETELQHCKRKLQQRGGD